MAQLGEKIKRLPCSIAVAFIKFYRKVISPVTPASCRFIPTCSEYGLTAFQRFGFKKGFVLTMKRLAKCRPGGPYGFDPVPDEYPGSSLE